MTKHVSNNLRSNSFRLSQGQGKRRTFFSSLKRIIVPLVYLCLSAALFFLTFPNSIFSQGLGFLGFFCLAPIPLLLKKIRFSLSPIAGFLHGYLSYFLFNLWLGTFNPVAFLFVPVIYGVYHMLLFPLLHLIQKIIPRWHFLVQALVWLVYEYLRIQGYLGYSFGVLGYSQSFYPAIIQSAEWFGVWGITFFCAFVGFFVGHVLSNLSHIGQKIVSRRILFVSAGIALLFLLNLFQGMQMLHRITPKESTLDFALIQHNTDPWKGGFSAYRNSLTTLIELSDKAIADTDPDFIVWSETAFVPSINFHLKHRENARYLRLIQQLKDYIAQYPDKDFVIGNSYSFLKEGRRKDHNAALLFAGNDTSQVYKKIHLVPFTEHFPYEELFPRIHSFLSENDVHYWEAGEEHTVFKSRFVRFSSPICFEDGFGRQNSIFVNNGAQLLVNITNDAWSGVESNAMQHLQLSVFRAIENRVPVLRSTNGGITAVLNHKGEVKQRLNSFTQDYLAASIDIPVAIPTLYKKFPNLLAILAIFILGATILFYTIQFVYNLSKSS